MNWVNISHGLLALYLCCLLAVPKVQSPLVALVCLTAIIGGQWRQPPALVTRAREGWSLLLPLVAYMLLILGQMAAGMLSGRDADQILMCLLAIGVLLSTVPTRAPEPSKWLLPAAAVGAIGACVLVSWQAHVLNIYRPPGHLGAGAVGSGAIKFGDLAGLLGLFALLLVLEGRQMPWRVLGLVGAMSGMYALALTQARGAVMGVLAAVFMLVWLRWLKARNQRAMMQHAASSAAAARSKPRSRVRMAIAGALAAVTLVAAGTVLAPRFGDIVPQYERFAAGDLNSEIGQRLTLWQIATRAGLHAPVTGIGMAGFGKEIQRQRDSGELPRDALVLYESAHNEYLTGFSAAGIPGLIIVVLFFWAPLWEGTRRYLRGQAPQSSMMLVMLSSAYAVYAMTDGMFDRQISMLAYFLLASWLLAAGSRSVSASLSEKGCAAGKTPRNTQTKGQAASVKTADPSAASAATAHAGGWPTAALAAGPVSTARTGASSGDLDDSLSVPGGLSVAIITKNEAHCIAQCLHSVAFADQIVVLDSGSTDDTVAIAQSLGAEVDVTPDWPGFGPQKNRALARCRHRWVLSIDADEQVTPALAEEIRSVLTCPPSPEGNEDEGQPPECVQGYWLRRSSRFCGQVIAHGLWGNDRVLRLFERVYGRFTDDPVHERLICSGQTRVLDGMLVHDSVDSLEDAQTKARAYAFLGASMQRAKGRGGIIRASTHAIWAFLRGYGLRAGFLDGRYGLTVAILHARGTYWKYRWAALPEDAWQALAASFKRS